MRLNIIRSHKTIKVEVIPDPDSAFDILEDMDNSPGVSDKRVTSLNIFSIPTTTTTNGKNCKGI